MECNRTDGAMDGILTGGRAYLMNEDKNCFNNTDI